MTSESHIKGVIKNAAIYATGSVLEKAAGFIMLPLYAHLLGSEGYGIIGMIEVAVGVLGIAVSFGTGSALYRFYFVRNTKETRHVFVSTANLTQIIFALAICIPAMLLSKPIAQLMIGSDGPPIYILLAVLAFMFETTGTIGNLYLLIQQRSIFVSILSITKFILAISLNIYFILILRLGVLGVLYTQLIIALIYSLFINIYTFKETGIHFRKDDIKEILRYSLPLLPGYIAMFVRSNADRIILRTYMGLAEIGVYAIVTKFSFLIGLFVHEPFMKTWAPKRMEICDTEEGPKTMSKVFTLHLTLMIFVGLILSLEIPLLIKVMAPSEFWITAIVAFFAVMSRIAFNSYYHFTFGLLYGKKTFQLSMIQIITATISVPLYILFIKYYGLLGAFVAAFVLYIVQCIITFLLAKPNYYIPFEWRKVLILCVSSATLFFMIQAIDLQHASFINLLDSYISPSTKWVLEILHLEHVKNGRLLTIVDEKLIYILEGFAKGMLGLSYLLVPIFLGIINKEHMMSIIRRLVPKRGFKYGIQR